MKAEQPSDNRVLNFDSSDSDSDEEEDLGMYFTHPQQLLTKFTELEEKNLFLIKLWQSSEDKLASINKQLREAQGDM